MQPKPHVPVMQTLLMYNGVYNIVCAISILIFWEHPLLAPFATMHTRMLVDRADAQNLSVQFFTAAWLVSNAIPRLAAGLHFRDATRLLATWSLYAEGYMVLFGSFLGLLSFPRAVMVGFLCMVMAKLTSFGE